MQFLTSALVLLLSVGALAKNILLTNDDGWQATNIRATYYKLKEAGHNVFLVAPVSQRSGFSGKFDIPTSPTYKPTVNSITHQLVLHLGVTKSMITIFGISTVLQPHLRFRYQLRYSKIR